MLDIAAGFGLILVGIVLGIFGDSFTAFIGLSFAATAAIQFFRTVSLEELLDKMEPKPKPSPRRGLVEVERPEALYGEYIPREEDPKEIWVKRPMIETYIDGVGLWVDRDAPRLPKKKNQDVIYLPDLKN